MTEHSGKIIFQGGGTFKEGLLPKYPSDVFEVIPLERGPENASRKVLLAL